jgi:hypothetical protein
MVNGTQQNFSKNVPTICAKCSPALHQVTLLHTRVCKSAGGRSYTLASHGPSRNMAHRSEPRLVHSVLGVTSAGSEAVTFRGLCAGQLEAPDWNCAHCSWRLSERKVERRDNTKQRILNNTNRLGDMQMYDNGEKAGHEEEVNRDTERIQLRRQEHKSRKIC